MYFFFHSSLFFLLFIKLEVNNVLILRVFLNVSLLFNHNDLSLGLPQLRYTLHEKLIC